MSYPNKEEIRLQLDFLEDSIKNLEGSDPAKLNMTTAEHDITVRLSKSLVAFGKEALALPDDPDPDVYGFNVVVSTFMILVGIVLKDGMVGEISHMIALTLGAFQVVTEGGEENDAVSNNLQ